MDNSLFDEATELAEARIEGKSEKSLAVIEQQQDIRFEKSLANLLMATPYIVWRREGKVKYYEHAPKTIEECPFQFKRIRPMQETLVSLKDVFGLSVEVDKELNRDRHER